MGGLFICARSRIATYDKKYYTEKKQTEGVDMYIADLHIHSRFSRATSRDGDAPHLDWWARRKGIAVLGTGDFTHPAWRAELKEQLVPAGDGVYTLREDLRLPGTAPGQAPRFVITGEISSIYKRGGKTRKVHNVILLPSLEAADELSARLEAVGNIRSDGRPILGLDSRDLLELTLDTCPDAEFIPAHIWTPHFAMFGAFSGFDSVEECFADLTPHIHAVETGLSSDPPMNWRVSMLDGLTLVSHSDAHSPSKLGREANLLDTEQSYPALVQAIRTGQGFLGTVEFFPEEGKYHLDGHRGCGVCLMPAETAEYGGRCPVCGKKLTIGVEHRVEELADRPAGFRPEGAKPFESLAPLPEVLAASTGGSATGKKTLEQYERMLQTLGPEFYILREAPLGDIAQVAGPCVAEGIRRLRAGPGTGKTKTLVNRIAYLVEQQGVKPDEITAVTFTNQAADEMRQRLQARLGGKRAVAKMTIGTFHAICLTLLGKVRLIAQSEALTVAEQVLGGQKGSARNLLQAVSRVKNGASMEEAGIEPEQYEAYCARLKALGALDFDDLLTQALQLDVTGQRRFTHLLVDEFQDINDTQFELVRAWSRRSRSLFVIGDADQAIYGFRGASGRCFERLLEQAPQTRLIHLVENYRSTPEILAASVPVIAKNPGGERRLHPNLPSGERVRLVQAADAFTEGIFIAKEIGRMTGGVDMLEAQKLGHDRTLRAFSDIAVLCRTHRQLELVERCLQHDDIPCVVRGREDFLDDRRVRGALAFFRAVQTPQDTAAVETALRILWDCPADLIEKAQAACQTAPDVPALRKALEGYELLGAWLSQMEQWQKPVQREKPWKLVDRWQQQYGASAELDRLKNMAVFHDSFDALWNALALGEEQDLSRAAGRGWKSGAVHLMTLHASKGLEFPAVFVAGVSAGMLPLEMAGRPTDLAEERRLLYVGMTRARQELIVTTSQEPSIFLADLPKGVMREDAMPRRSRPADQMSLF